MQKSKTTKITAAAMAALLLIGLCIGGYFIFRPKNESPNTPVAPPKPSENITVSEDNLILIEGGSFTMGSPTSEAYRGKDEDCHNVTVSSFYVDPYEVTQADYTRIMGTNPSYFKGDALPVDSVTWYQAIEYCNKLSEEKNLTPVYTISGNTVTWNRAANGYRLLTEAEWEFAARGGTTTPFYTGNYMSASQANYQGSYPYKIEENYSRGTVPSDLPDKSDYTGTVRGTTVRVDSLTPNAYGLYHMSGNVSEWCFDYYAAYDTEDLTDPTGAASGSLRVNRGGGFNDFGKHLRSAYRSATNPIDADRNLGFRIGRNAESGQGNVETTYSLSISVPQNPKVLVAYFSYSGNTEEAAQMIAQKTGGDLFVIERASGRYGSVYPESADELVKNARPALKNHVADMSEYDVILLGYPTWWATAPMAVLSFLEEYDFSGKTVVTFSSHGGTIFGDSVSDVCKTIPDAYVGIGYEFYYGSSNAADISAWLAENRIPEQ